MAQGSQSVCKHHCFDTEAYGTIRNSKKKSHSRCCEGRKLATARQACKMPASTAPKSEHELVGLVLCTVRCWDCAHGVWSRAGLLDLE